MGTSLHEFSGIGATAQAHRAHKCSFHPDRKDPYLRLGTVTVFVRDQERSLRFYQDQLGFEVAFDEVRPSGERWLVVSPPDGTAFVSLAVAKPNSEDYTLIGQPTEIVFMTDDVPAKFRQWSARGVRFHHEPQGHEWGAVSAEFEDIDGNSFTLLSIEPVTGEIEAERRAHAKRHEAEQHAARELELARQVQARLFPQFQPMASTLEYAGMCIQARHLGGDYYDFLDLGHDRLGLVVADVAGKGAAAALLMANLQAHLHNQVSSYWSRPYAPLVLNQPERFLRSVNRLFHGNTTDDAYATLFFAEYDNKQARLRYANCGHLAGLLLRRDGSLETLDSTCTAVGLFQDFNCVAAESNLNPGDTLALYTDGVTEAFNDAGEEFGEERLIDTLCANRTLPYHMLLSRVIEEIRSFGSQQQHDDITLVVARCKEA